MRLGSGRCEILCYVCASTIALFSACVESAGTPRRLPSGRVVEVVESGIIDESTHTWAIRYRTQVAAADRDEMDEEAAELWAEVQAEADACGATRASLWPANLDRHEIRWDRWHPILYTTPSFDFTFEKDASGSWKRILHGVPVEQLQ